MTAQNPFRFPSAKLIAIAAVAGIVAGAGAVYVKRMGPSNGAAQTAASGQCEAARPTIAALSAAAKGQVAAMAPVSEPRKLGQLAFKDGDGKDIKLADFTGKAVLLNLWATWCVPCREEMPALNALQKAKAGPGFEVVAVNIDTGDNEKPKAFLAETGVDALKLYHDPSMGVFNDLKKEGLAFGLPVTLMLDAKGCLIGAMNGPAAWDSEDAKALVQAVQAKNDPV